MTKPKDIKTLEDLTPDGQNFNKHTQFGQKLLEDSLRKFGAGRSILVDRDGNIIAGNSTTETAAAIGLEKVKVVQTDGTELVVVQRTDLSLDSPQGRELALADNMTALKGIDIDLDKVSEMLGEDMAKAWGLELPDHRQAQEDDFDPDAAVETVCKKGDIWKLGNHRLMCGDSTDPADVALLMDGEKADIAFTSPPYGVGLNYNEYKDTFENTKALVENVFPIMGEYTKDYLVLNWEDITSAREINKTTQPSMFAWLPFYLSILEKCGWSIWAERVWKKPHARCSGIWSASSNRPVNDWEYIFTFTKGEPSYNERNNGSYFGVIDSSEDGQSDTLKEHPGAFPVFVPSKVILIHSKENASILDLFGGTGTTLIAAEQLNRKCYMMELDPHYCDVIIARWEKLTNQKAERITQ